MISFNDITKLFSHDLEGKFCIEIEFSVKECPEYQFCWMGKMPDDDNEKKDIFWFGLTPDNSQGYGYDNFDDFSSAPVFRGKSLKEIWNRIEILSIDGCNPQDRILIYI